MPVGLAWPQFQRVLLCSRAHEMCNNKCWLSGSSSRIRGIGGVFVLLGPQTLCAYYNIFVIFFLLRRVLARPRVADDAVAWSESWGRTGWEGSLWVLTSLTSSVKQSNANSCHFLQVRRSGKLCAQASWRFPFPFLLHSFSVIFVFNILFRRVCVCSEISCNPVIMPAGEWEK